MYSQILTNLQAFWNHLCCGKQKLSSQDDKANLCLLSSVVSFGWKIHHVGGHSMVWIQVLSLTPYTVRRQQTQVLKLPVSWWHGHKHEDIQIACSSFALVMTQGIS